MAKVGVVRLDKLKDEVTAAVTEARKTNPSLFESEPEIVFLKDPGIIGFIVPAEKFQEHKLSDVADLAHGIGGSLGGRGGLVIHDRNIIVGFLPSTGQFEP
jgi:hypothetical protein